MNRNPAGLLDGRKRGPEKGVIGRDAEIPILIGVSRFWGMDAWA